MSVKPEQEQRLLRHFGFAHRGWTTLNTRDPEKFGTEGGESDTLDRGNKTSYMGHWTRGEYDAGLRLVTTTNSIIVPKIVRPRYGSRHVKYMMKNMFNDAVRRRCSKDRSPAFNAENDWEILRMFDNAHDALVESEDTEEISRLLRSPLMAKKNGPDITAKLYLATMYTSLYFGRTCAKLLTYPRVAEIFFSERDAEIKKMGPVVTLDKEQVQAIDTEYSAKNIAAFERSVQKSGGRMPPIILDFAAEAREVLLLDYNDGNPRLRLQHLTRQQLIEIGLITEAEAMELNRPMSRVLQRHSPPLSAALSLRLQQNLIDNTLAVTR